MLTNVDSRIVNLVVAAAMLTGGISFFFPPTWYAETPRPLAISRGRS